MKILDCTLRDGGYYTNWDFDKELVSNYFDSLNKLPIDYLEIGYKSNPMKEYLGEYFYCPDIVLHDARKASKKKLAIILDEKDIHSRDVRNLLQSCIGLIDMVRIALAPDKLERALKLAEIIKHMGFEVGFNVMYMSRWKQEKAFLKELKYLDELADYFYMVDSFGGIYPEDVKEIISLVKEHTKCAIGFHGHNNLELALMNTLTAIEYGADIVDATITGMGRGAGNMKTELLLTALNTRNDLPVDFNALSSVVDGFTALQQKYGWGTNLPYMVSGANSLPQKDVMEWVTGRFYSFNSIIRALHNQKDNKEDNQKLPIFTPLTKHVKAVIIGGGPNSVHHMKAIRAYIMQHTDICLIHASSKNSCYYNDIDVPQYYCLVGNEGHRLEKVFNGLGNFEGTCVLPPYPRKMGTYVPKALMERSYELNKIDFTDKYVDSGTVLALQSAIDLGALEIILVGYDGYQDKVITQQERMWSEENEYSLGKIEKIAGMTMYSLTPTNYKSLRVQSVYSFLI